MVIKMLRDFHYYTQREVCEIFSIVVINNGELVTHEGMVVLCI